MLRLERLLSKLAHPTSPAAEFAARRGVSIFLSMTHAAESDAASMTGRLPDGRFETLAVADDSSFVEEMRGMGDTYGEFLRSYVGAFDSIPEMDSVPDAIIVCGGAGNAFAVVQFLDLAGDLDVSGSVRFGRHSDDAPWAGLDNFTRIPGNVLQVLHDLFIGVAKKHPRLVDPATAHLGSGTRKAVPGQDRPHAALEVLA